MDAEQVIGELGLEPHPEGGWYRSSYRPEAAGRPPVTAIYFLLVAGVRSAWHRVDATELWHHYAGDAVTLHTATEGAARGAVESTLLGVDLAAGERPQAVVAPGTWQCAESQGAWSLCGCTVSPGFEWSGFELAPEGWEP